MNNHVQSSTLRKAKIPNDTTMQITVNNLILLSYLKPASRFQTLINWFIKNKPYQATHDNKPALTAINAIDTTPMIKINAATTHGFEIPQCVNNIL